MNHGDTEAQRLQRSAPIQQRTIPGRILVLLLCASVSLGLNGCAFPGIDNQNRDPYHNRAASRMVAPPPLPPAQPAKSLTNHVALTWNGAIHFRYIVQGSTNLHDWYYILGPKETNEVFWIACFDRINWPREYYRIVPK